VPTIRYLINLDISPISTNIIPAIYLLCQFWTPRLLETSGSVQICTGIALAFTRQAIKCHKISVFRSTVVITSKFYNLYVTRVHATRVYRSPVYVLSVQLEHFILHNTCTDICERKRSLRNTPRIHRMGVEVQLYSFLTLTLGGGRWMAPLGVPPRRFPDTHFTGGCLGPWTCLNKCGD